MGIDLEQAILAYKTLQRIFCLQLLCLIFFAYGLFFFHKQLTLVSHQDLKFVDRNSWFESPQYETIALLIVENKNLFNNIELPENIYNLTIEMKREPQCYQGQEISALMTGSYSFLLDYVYSQEKLIEDSIFHQLNHTNKQIVYLGEQSFWQDIFPDMIHSEYDHQKDLKEILISSNSNKVDFLIGLIEDENQFYQQVKESLSELKKKTLILILEQDECSIYGSKQSTLRAFSNNPFQQTVALKDIEREEIDIASTLAAVMGIPIPFCNFGQVIPELYSKDMELELNGEKYSEEFRTWYTVFYHIVLNAHQIEHYLIQFQKYYPLFFDSDQVSYLKEEIKRLSKAFNNTLDGIEPNQQGSENEKEVILKIKNEIIHQRQIMKQVEQVIQHSNFGQIHIMIISFIFFAVSFSYLVACEFKGTQNKQLFANLIKSSFYFNHTSPVNYNFNIILTTLLAITFIFFRQDYIILMVDIILHVMLILNLDSEKIKKYIILSCINIAINARCLGLIKLNWAIKIADNIGVHTLFDFCAFLVILWFAYKTLSRIYIIEVEFITDPKKRKIFKVLILSSFINILISGIQYFLNDIISHDSASFFIMLFFALTTSILMRPFIDKSDDFNKLNCEAKWVLVSINILPLIFLDTHNEHIFIILILYLYQLFNFFHLIKNAGYLNSSLQVCYLMFLTIIIFQKGLLGSIEMSSLKNAIHIDHHHSHEESNIIITSTKKGEDSDGNVLFSIISNCIQIGTAPLVLGGIFPIFQKIANKARTIPREKFQNQSILQLLFDQDNFLSIENNYIHSLKNLIIYLLLLILILSFRIIFIFLNLTFTYNNDFQLFRFYKEIFIFEIINFIFIYFTILLCIHLFVQLNQQDQQMYELASSSQNEQSEIVNKSATLQKEESEYVNINNRVVRKDSSIDITLDDEL